MKTVGWRWGIRLAVFVCAASLPSVTLAAARLYDNTGNPTNTYYSAQGGNEAIDDLHLVSGGTLDSLVFEYYDPATGGTLTATANLYANPGGLDLDTQTLAGPFTVAGLPRGRKRVAIPLPHVVATADIWVGVRFSSTTAGLIINSAPSVGSSHDFYLENGGFYWFEGNPKANFGLRVVGTAAPVAVDDAAGAAGVELAPAHPNPFGAGTSLRYALDRRGFVRLDVCDVSGRRVCALVNGVREAGRHTERWPGRDDAGRVVGAGVYFVRLESAGRVVTRRVVFAP